MQTLFVNEQNVQTLFVNKQNVQTLFVKEQLLKSHTTEIYNVKASTWWANYIYTK
jgi:hypothetical protein